MEKLSLLTSKDANILISRLLSKTDLQNPLIQTLLNDEKPITEIEFENGETKPKYLDDVESVLYNLEYGDRDAYDRDTYENIDWGRQLADGFEKYYIEQQNELRKNLSISSFNQFNAKYYKDYIDDETIQDKYNEETNNLSDEEFKIDTDDEVSRIKKYITVETYTYSLSIYIPIGYLIPFIISRGYTNLDNKAEMIDEYIQFNGLNEYPEIFRNNISAEYDNKGKFYDAVNDYFLNIMDKDNDCNEIEQKFNLIYNDVFKNNPVLENDLVIMKLVTTVVDCENKTVPIILVNKQTNKKFEGEVKIDNLSAYALNYKLFEHFMNFNKLIL
jgi:hypothetical protein